MIAAKAELRIELAPRRAALHAAQPLAGLTLSARLPRLAGAPGVVAAYWPFRSEVDPRPLMQRFARAGWTLALPVTPGRGVHGPLRFHRWSAETELAEHAFGMREPHPEAEVVRPDVVLVPLLGFDQAGHRLGFGAGHYDRTLADLRATGWIRAIGVAFAGQQVDRLPVGDHDQPLDAILTERGYQEFARPPR